MMLHDRFRHDHHAEPGAGIAAQPTCVNLGIVNA
jgi:hypothetical protein